jgi:hypothetical protein
MRGKTRKFIARNIREKNETLIMTIRNYVGNQATLFNTNQLYRWSKKLWKSGELKKAMGKAR